MLLIKWWLHSRWENLGNKQWGHMVRIVNKYRQASFPELHPAIAVKKTIEKGLEIIA